MVLVKQQDMQLEAGYFGNHVWFFDVHTPPGLFSCKPSKATGGKWVSSCKARTHYAETEPFLGAAKCGCLVSLQKQCRVSFPFTMTPTKSFHLPYFHLYFPEIFIFPDQYEQCCHQRQTSVLVGNWACTSESDVKFSQTIFSTRHHESLSLVG